MMNARIALYTLFALVAFAANSVLCRLALVASTIDAASFSTLRLASGAVMLFVIPAFLKTRDLPRNRNNWTSATMLCLYAVTFSFAYNSLTTGTGALILFGAVQATMILTAVCAGERPSIFQWVGLILALGGLVYLVLPGLAAPPPLGSTLMATAGIAWGVYSLRGRGAPNPLADTSRNFALAIPLALCISLVGLRDIHLSSDGILLAVVSGAVTSGLGYVIWYAALRGLTVSLAAIVQLSVPALAALGGVVFLSEEVSTRLVFAAIMILGGVGLAVASRVPAGHIRVTEPKQPT